MNQILSAAFELQSFFEMREWQFCFIGGIAVLRWGKPRTTQDVDVSLFVDFGREPETIEEVLSQFDPRIDDADQFALESKVILAQSAQGVPLDIAIAQFDFEQNIIKRSTHFEFATGIKLLTVSAEDLVVMKAFAGREQDWADVEGIISANKTLDQKRILGELSLLVELVPDHDGFSKLRTLMKSNEE
jgi:predicted nucleotidyltransferase